MEFPRFLFMIALVGLMATVTSAQPATRNLTVGQPVIGHLLAEGLGVETWGFEGAAGQVVSVTVRSDLFERPFSLCRRRAGRSAGTTKAATDAAEAASLRRREVVVDPERLARLATATRPVAAPALVLNLFDDIVLTATVERRTPAMRCPAACKGSIRER